MANNSFLYLFVRRFLIAIPTLLCLLTIAFFMMRITPGGPFDTEKDLPPIIQENLNKIYHLDEPLYQQYFRYLGQLLQGDFGPSFQYKDFTVNELIYAGFPISLRLGLSAIFLAIVVGSIIGAFAALKQNSRYDYALMTFAMTGISIPNFVMAPVLILIFAIGLQWLPAGSWNNGAFNHTMLPIISLALPQIAYVSRIMRGSMIEVLNSPYIRTAKAKGLPFRHILFKHAFKPAFIPILSYLGPATAGVITGSVVIEQIFGIPGLGRYFVQGALNRDYTLVMGVVVFYGTLIIMFNFLVDVLYRVFDPRIKS
ncbi:oligopeptide ABC transporter permease OppB [Candidatus Marinamargulisbacteria bacterium SCGC AG-414-C22]|nr:oligopeptide ABC transporter permease OppB [Candidatus Marinamargulisbacteria bacterium SCGC AG-414-C22]